MFFNTIYIVTFGITEGDKNGDGEVQENFRHLFDSIVRNDERGVENYRNILQQEAAKHQETFYMMKQQFHVTRPREKASLYKRSTPKEESGEITESEEVTASYETLKALYKEEKSRRMESDKKYFVIQCGQEQRYAIKYFEMIFTQATNLNLPDLQNMRLDVKNQSFLSHISSNPTVHISSGCSAKFNDLNETSQERYRHIYMTGRLTQVEKWILLPRWLAYSDEYTNVTNGDKIFRLKTLVQTIRSQLNQDSSLTCDLITACVLYNWDRLCDLVKVAPKNFNYTEVLEKFFTLGRNNPRSQISKYCVFLLQNIIEEKPLSTAEKEVMKKFWTNESNIAIESWELDLNRPMRGSLPI